MGIQGAHPGKFADQFFSLTSSFCANNNRRCSRDRYVVTEFTESPNCECDSRGYRSIRYDLGLVLGTSDCKSW